MVFFLLKLSSFVSHFHLLGSAIKMGITIKKIMMKACAIPVFPGFSCMSMFVLSKISSIMWLHFDLFLLVLSGVMLNDNDSIHVHNDVLVLSGRLHMSSNSPQFVL